MSVLNQLSGQSRQQHVERSSKILRYDVASGRRRLAVAGRRGRCRNRCRLVGGRVCATVTAVVGSPTLGQAQTRQPATKVTPLEYDETRFMGYSREFNTRYELQQQVGKGSFGIVYSAIDKESLQEVAVKVLPKAREGMSPLSIQYKIKSEVESFKAVQGQPSVARLYGVYEDEHRVYIVMEICIGGDLKELVQESGPLSEAEAAHCMAQILSTIKACHDNNMCYGDVKPANFLVKDVYPSPVYQSGASRRKGRLVVKAVDFGCSQKLNRTSNLSRRTGTPLFMAPEMFMRDYRNEVDNWAAGVLLYQLLTDRPAFWNDWDDLRQANNSTLMLHIMTNPINMKNLNGVSDEAKDLIKRLLDKVPSSRITAQEALEHPWIVQHTQNEDWEEQELCDVDWLGSTSSDDSEQQQSSEDEVVVCNKIIRSSTPLSVNKVDKQEGSLPIHN